MELIMAILMALGLISASNEKVNFTKIQSTKQYQKMYSKTNVHLQQEPNKWATVLFSN
jgi:sortase (surface protein transpeptidase)